MVHTVGLSTEVPQNNGCIFHFSFCQSHKISSSFLKKRPRYYILSKMCAPNPQCCFSDDGYDPKLKVGTTDPCNKQGVSVYSQYASPSSSNPSSRRPWLLVVAAMAVLSGATFTGLRVSLHRHQDHKKVARDLAMPPPPRTSHRLLRKKETTPRRLFDVAPVVVSSAPQAPLTIQNLPQQLAWKKGEKHPRPSIVKLLPVDVGYIYNPSILELANGKQIFALRMGWLFGSGCEKIMAAAEAASPESSDFLLESTFHCFKHHQERFIDQTLLGEFDATSNTMMVRDQGPAPSSLLSLNQDFDFATSWDAGAFWHDTRLQHPFNHRPMPGLDKILLTSQNIEILGHADWNALDNDSNLVLQLTYITALDPSRILDPVTMNRHKMTRWLYYDAALERQEWDRRQQIGGVGGVELSSSSSPHEWQLSSFDVARLKCHQRPAGLPALPFDPQEVSVMNPSTSASSLLDPPKLNNSWYFIKDKNWSPFAYEGKVLWSYKLAPHHVVCENDVDLTQDGTQDVDCVLCVTKYNSTSSHVFDDLYRGLRQQGYDNAVAHMNGAPAYFVPDKNLYLGLMHVIKENRTTDELGWGKTSKTYEHYFYALEATPPFRVAAVATVRIALERSRAWSNWFDIDHAVTVEFAMYMQYHPDRPGREIVISYGDGDRLARTATVGMDDVWASFNFSATSLK
jgi:hypothetical protein